MLRRFGLELPRRADERDKRQMHKYGIFAADLMPELTHRFQKRQGFDVAGRPSDFRNHDVKTFAAGERQNPLFNGVRNVRHHLDRGAEEITAPLFCDHFIVNLARRHVI